MGETNRNRGHKAAPRLEALEDRSLPSVTTLVARPEGSEVVDVAPQETKPDVPIDAGLEKGSDETFTVTADESGTDESGGDVFRPNIYFLPRGMDGAAD